MARRGPGAKRAGGVERNGLGPAWAERHSLLRQICRSREGHRDRSNKFERHLRGGCPRGRLEDRGRWRKLGTADGRGVLARHGGAGRGSCYPLHRVCRDRGDNRGRWLLRLWRTALDRRGSHLGGAFFDTPAGGARMSKIVIDPATAGSPTSSTVFAATSGGLYKSTTSGTSWTLVLTGGFTDLVADPTNGSTLYAAGSPRNDGVYEVDKSTDGGANWIALSARFPPVFPSSSFGRIQIAISASSPATLYAAVTKDGTGSLLGLFKTENAGATWID